MDQGDPGNHFHRDDARVRDRADGIFGGADIRPGFFNPAGSAELLPAVDKVGPDVSDPNHFTGFFLTMIFAVNARGFMMYWNDDPLFLWRDMIVFGSLA